MATNSPSLTGYRCVEKLYDGTRSFVYRARRTSDDTAVVIKCLNNPYPSFHELTQFRNQYTIAKQLNLPGIVQPIALEPYKHGFALIMQETHSIDLKTYLSTHTFTLNEFFDFAISMADILQGLYQKRVLHKDIKPANILIHPDTHKIHLIDFSLSSLLPKEIQELQTVRKLQGTLSYISPEQTGRMNRGIDHRTDYYAFGISCYEILTQQLPYVSDDPMTLIHNHLAKTPTPPNQINTAIPNMVNDLILKLMAKTIEERYQSAFGLKQDLKQCQTTWAEHQKIAPFVLGQHDISQRFQVSNRLYGRQQEVVQLLEAFDRVCNGALEMILVAGFSGIGKTALIHEVHKPMTQQRGYFAKGKFDQFKRDIPFSALVQALRMLMQQLLDETPEQLAVWKSKLQAVLNDHANPLIEIVPELADILGQQNAPDPLPGDAKQRQFYRLFQLFIQTLATQEHPLVLFLDDLQWADSATLNLLTHLQQSQYLLLLGAYRHNEVPPAHPLMLTLDSMRNAGTPIHQLKLGPLPPTDLNHLVAKSLRCSSQQAAPMSQVVHQKTQGNPFYIHQFLKFLYEDGLITFDGVKGCWCCNLDTIKPLVDQGGSVVDLMTLQLRKLPLKTQTALQLAACIGNVFDLDTLATVYEHTLADTASAVWSGLQEGLVLPLNEAYKIFQSTDNDVVIDTDNLGVCYRFLHDRVQQAAYGLIDANQKHTVHLKIGRLLKQRTRNLDEHIFDIVNQLNLGKTLITEPTERATLIHLNIEAAQKALRSTAYAATSRYCDTAIGLLPAHGWHTDYAQTLALYETAAEAALLQADFATHAKHSNTLLAQATSPLDTIKTHQLTCQRLIAQNQRVEATETALKVLTTFDICFPQQPSDADVQDAFDTTQALLAPHSIESLRQLPRMTDPQALAAIKLMFSITSPACDTQPRLWMLLLLRQVCLSVRHGNSLESILSYAGYGELLCSRGEIEQGNQFAQFALSLIDTLSATVFKAFIYASVYSSSHIWVAHIRETLAPLQAGYHNGLEMGDHEYCAIDAYWYITHALFAGVELVQLAQESQTYREAITELHQTYVLDLIGAPHQVILNLLGQSNVSNALEGRAYSASKNLPELEQAQDVFSLGNLKLYQLMLHYLFNDKQQAVQAAVELEQYLTFSCGRFLYILFCFYDALAHLRIYADVSSSEQSAILAKVAAHQEKFRAWSKQAPMNCQHKWALLEAERLRVTGARFAAMGYYEQAIQGAKDNQYKQDEALAYELAAEFYLTWHNTDFAQTCLKKAYYGYARWGAKAKVADLEQRYPTLLDPILHPATSALPASTSISTSAHTQSTPDTYDLNTLMKSSRVLSGELALKSLLKKMLAIVMENAGATRGQLILQHAGQWWIKGDHDIPLTEAPDLPATLIQYVINQRQTMVLDDARHHPRFHADAYFQANPDIKSVLCQPIFSHTKLIGLLYLENSLMVGAFHAKRLEILQMLSAQAAISIDNATLYETLEDKVMQRTQQLKQVQAILIKQAHDTGKAEMAISVMHNIGNALTPIKIGAATSQQRLQDSAIRQHLDKALSPLADIVTNADISDAEKLRFTQIIRLLPQTIQDEYKHTIQALSRMSDNIQHIEEIIHLQMRYTQVKTRRQALNINTLIRNALTLIKESIQQYNVIAEFSEHATLPPYYGEESKLMDVFLSLIKNGCEAMASVCNQARILTLCTRFEAGQPDHIVFTITDNGIGFKPENKNRLFNAGFSTKQQGTGFGLHACGNYLIAQAASIDAQSDGLGQGATFTVRLPINDKNTE